ncbi:MAG: DUF4199 domain-containing protein [Sphingobacteriales bacterium]|nr:DUF4199 domain-containing protein [Sphingobacteriales bacterium]
MHIRLLPALKGLITALVMIGVGLGLYYSNQPSDSIFQYLMYGIYAAGILWTLIAYRRSAACTGKFGDLFNQGFRCFIVVMIIMVTFTFVFSKMHPEFAEESAKAYKEALLKEKTKDKTPAEIDDEVSSYKNRYTTVLVYGAIFGYLIIGAGVTAAASAVLMRRKN